MKTLEILKTEIEIGLATPVRLLQLTDSHISLWDENDRIEEPDKVALAQWRRREFDNGVDGQSEALYLQGLAYAKKEGIPIVYTGDFVDFLSHANFEYMDKTLGNTDYFYCAGNHDFCHFVGRATEDYAYKWEKIKTVQPHVRQNLIFDSRIVGGVNLVAVDDSYYLFTEGQLEMLRAEVAKGYPIILFLHVPLYSPKLGATVFAENHQCMNSTGAPDAALERFEAYRRTQQTPDKATRRMAEYISNEPLIRAIVCGHMHMNFEEPLPDGLHTMQYTTAGTYQGYARELILK